MTNKELESRLIKFDAMVIEPIKSSPDNRVTNHLCGQLLRSATSRSLNYGEALGGESKKDFTLKLGIILRESLNCLRILGGAGYLATNNLVVKECNELVSIFVRSVETSKRNLSTENHKTQIARHESQIK